MPPRRPRAIRNETPQPRRQNVMMSRQLTAERETPQAPQDRTALTRALYQEQQASLGVARGIRPGGNPNNPGQPVLIPPSQLQCLLLPDAEVIYLDWDRTQKILAVATASDTVTMMRQQGLYWEVMQSVPLPGGASGIGGIAVDQGSLWVSTSAGQYFWPNWRNVDDTQLLRGTKAVDGLISSRSYDTNPDWPDQVSPSYESEAVPAGEYRGPYVDVAAAIADGAVKGDWYYDQTADQWREITGIPVGSDNLLQYSEQFDNAYWNKFNGATVVADQAIAPDGEQTADLIQANGDAQARVRLGLVLVVDTTYTYSVYLKAGTSTLTRHVIDDFTNSTIVELAWANGNASVSSTSGDPVQVDLQSAGGGWYRLTITLTAQDTGALSDTIQLFPDAALGTGNVYAWGAQAVEAQFEAVEAIMAWNFNNAPKRIFRDTFTEKPTVILNDTFSSSRRLYTDEFARLTFAPWIDASSGTGTATMTGAVVRLTRDVGAVNAGQIRLEQATEAGKWYRIQLEQVGASQGSTGLFVGTTPGGNDILDSAWAAGVGTWVFQATTAVSHITTRSFVDSSTRDLDNFVFEEVSALAGYENRKGAAVGDVTWDGNNLVVSNTGAPGFATASKAIETTLGTTYRVRGLVVSGTPTNDGTIVVHANPDGTGTIAFAVANPGETADFTFVGDGTTVYVGATVNSANVGADVVAGNITVEELPAPANWIDSSAGTESLYVLNGEMQLNRVDSLNRGIADLNVPATLDKWYRVRVDVKGAGGVNVRCGTTQGNNNLGEVTSNAPFVADLTFQLFAGDDIWVRVSPNDDGTTPSVDNLLIEEVTALEGWEPVTGGGTESLLAQIDNRLSCTVDGTFDGAQTDITGLGLVVGELYFVSGEVDPGTAGRHEIRLSTQTIGALTSPGTVSKAVVYAAGDVFLITRNTDAPGQPGEFFTDNISISTAKAVIPAYYATDGATADSSQILRAGSAQFPERLVIDTLATQTVVYEIVDDVATMWMVFEQATDNMLTGAANSLDYSDGCAFVGKTAQGMQKFCFAEDSAFGWREGGATGRGAYQGDISQRNDALGYDGTGPAIVDANVNDVASQVLSSVAVTNELSNTEDWQPAYWIKQDATAESATLISNTNSGRLIVAGLPYAQTAVASVDIRKTVGATTYPALNVTFGGVAVQNNVAILDTNTGNFVAYGVAPPDAIWVEDKGDWWRLHVRGVDGGSNTSCEFAIHPAYADTMDGTVPGNLSGTIEATNAQLELSARPHDYVPSATGPTTGQTRPAKKFRTRSNELHDSNDFSSATWARFTSGGGIPVVDTPTSEKAPTGELATKLFFDASSGESVIRYNFTSGYPYQKAVFSFYAKLSVGQSFYMRIDWAGSSTFVLNDGTGDWVRYELEAPAAFTGTSVSCQFGAVPAAGSSAVLDMLVASAQFEEGLSGAAEGYIPAVSAPSRKTEDTSLFIPAWSVATDGGVSVGLDTGDIFDITGQTDAVNQIDFTDDDKVLTIYRFTSELAVYDVPAADQGIDPFARRYFPTSQTVADIGAPRILNPGGLTMSVNSVALDADGIAAGRVEGLTIIAEDTTDYFDGAATHVTDTYNTGPMVKVLGAWANDSDSDPIGAPFALIERFDDPNKSLFWDEFNRTDPAPWVASNANQSIVNGSLRVEQAATGTTAYSTLQQTTVVGKWYRITADYTNRNITAGGAQFRIGNTPDGLENAVVSLGVPPESVDETFQATGTDTYITLRLSGSTDTGNYIDFDNVLIEEVPALDEWEDESLGTGSVSVSGGKLNLERTDISNLGRVERTIPTEAGKNYVLSLSNETTGGTTQLAVRLGTTSLGSDLLSEDPAAGSPEYSFAGTGSDVFLSVFSNAGDGTTAIVDDITVREDVTETLPDNSGQGNNGAVIGEVTREKFNRCTYGVCCDDENYVRLTGASGDELQGWFKQANGAWQFFESASEIPEIEKDGNDYLLKNGCYGHLMLSGEVVDLGEFGPGFGEGFD